MAVIRRGRVNSAGQIVVSLDPAMIADAADAAVADDLLVLDVTFPREIRPDAVIASPRGVTRAFYRTPWRWQQRTLGHILYLATLRG